MSHSPSTLSNPRLTGRTAIVTGGSRGIGAAIARRLAADGARVAVVYRSNGAEADAVVRAIRGTDAEALAVQADVSDTASVHTMVDTAQRAFGSIDILVNNAGILASQPVGGIDQASFDRQFRTNAFSTILVSQAVLPQMPARGGRIVNVSSSLVFRPRAGLAVYAASKAAVSALTQAFALELGPRNITVNAVAPAMTRTDMTAPLPDELKARMRDATPLGRLAEPDDIADAVAFLASDDSRWITGRTLLTDGGFI
ncbi:SDR family NAD(P)-dependent oxidoreductase (plasmid) [Ralstonia syzygii subsp. celebesensis]|uniref:Dehydrogenase n=2 Tax=Ralstonia syzygii subsp. celebesensis TaxID=1310168 RepID=A0A1U9VM47_9RALS|nr:3-oxoacyl-ACP reductase family protein [Ralstonia syzygii]AQW31646.1 dehydrogenase [blood disease bacterium A2-HR MARDI]QQV58232.1 3-oxoacyl-ACP reductase FabG [Ralstonia syzygii subsp. celebesensis]CCA83845.1 3-oxoacyl-(acyl-carrier-protein) reductase [blood disease bacterium R229]